MLMHIVLMANDDDEDNVLVVMIGRLQLLMIMIVNDIVDHFNYHHHNYDSDHIHFCLYFCLLLSH